MTDPLCRPVREMAAELALGVLSGRERAAALGHLEQCAACRDHVAQLTAAADGLLDLLPGSEPPVGFENRVIARLAPGTARRRRTRRTVAAAVAAAAALGGALAGGWALGRAQPAQPSAAGGSRTEMTTATFVEDGRPVGHAYASVSGALWVYMAVDLDQPTETVTCQVVDAAGHVSKVGTFPLNGGYGYWGAPAPGATGHLEAVRLLDPRGDVVAAATFPPNSSR